MSEALLSWVYAAVPAGVILLVMSWWLTARGVLQPAGVLQRGMRFFGMALILLPGALDWYFSHSLILLFSLALFAYGAFCWLKRG